MSKLALFVASCVLAIVAFAVEKPIIKNPLPAQVIDLGQLKIEGAARGPEIQLIDAGRADAETTERIVQRELLQLERELLRSELTGARK